MSDGKQIIVPAYLLQERGDTNESLDTEFKFLHDYNGRGYISKQPDGYIKSYNVGHVFPDVDHSEDWTAEVTFKFGQTLWLCNYRGNNTDHSNSQIRFQGEWIYFNFWGTYQGRRFYKIGETDKVDSEGNISWTVIKSGGKISFYCKGELMTQFDVSNRLTSSEVRWLYNDAVVKRFAFTPTITLAPNIHYGTEEAVLKNKADNLRLVDVGTDVYYPSVFDEDIVTHIESFGSWLFAKWSKGKIVAFLRPRGLDRGNSIASASYNYATDEITFIDENGVSYTVQVPIEEGDSGIVVPAGTGVLSTSGVHKELSYGEGFKVIPQKSSYDKVAFNGESNATEDFIILSTNSKPNKPIDYSSRLTMDCISENLLNLNADDPKNWQEITGELTTSDPESFDLSYGSIYLEPGEYYIKGTLRRTDIARGGHVIRISDGRNTIFSKSIKINPATQHHYMGTTNIEIETHVFIREPLLLKVEELAMEYNGGSNASQLDRFSTGLIDIFKL